MSDKIARFLSVGRASGWGYGSGSGDGDGDGWGSGWGYGSGDGYGRVSGLGSGWGSGSGSGSGSGWGYGWGSGSGYGSGDGSGSGSGWGSGSLHSVNGQAVHYIDDLPTIITSVHGSIAQGGIVKFDFTLKPCYIARVGDCFAHGDTLHDAVRDATAKALEDEPVEERVARFRAAYPDYNKPVSCRELFDWHHILTGSCEAGRRQFCRDHDIDLDASYTVRYFIDITRDAYGGGVIKLLDD